ncbi:MAG: hypothetical protein QM664_06010 [Flavihumibacter sp.]
MKTSSVVFGGLAMVVTLFLCSCTDQRLTKQELTFIVPPDTMPAVKPAIPGEPPPPPPKRAYYFPVNFVIDSVGRVFYYQQPFKRNDDEITDWNTPPNFIHLSPQALVEVPDQDIEQVLKSKILTLGEQKRYVAIGCETDTVVSKGLYNLLQAMKNEGNHIKWKFRKVTQEERIVLGFKKRQQPYNPQEIQWDSSQIRFSTSNDE